MEKDGVYRDRIKNLIIAMLLETYPNGSIPLEDGKVLIKNRMIHRYPELDQNERFDLHYNYCYYNAFNAIAVADDTHIPCIVM